MLCKCVCSCERKQTLFRKPAAETKFTCQSRDEQIPMTQVAWDLYSKQWVFRFVMGVHNAVMAPMKLIVTLA